MWRRPLTSEDLVEEHLDVVGGEGLRGHDHLVEVALHQLRDDVSGRPGVKAKRRRAQRAASNAGLDGRTWRGQEEVGQEVRGDEDELKTARTRRIHLLEAIDLRRLQDVQSRENLREDRGETLERGDKRRRRPRPRPVLTLSCLKKHSILSSLKTLLQETRFWKTLGIFFKATLRPSRGSVTDLRGTAA